MIGTLPRILPALDTFDHDLAVPVLSYPCQIIPSKVRINVITHDPANTATSPVILRTLPRHRRGQAILNFDTLVFFSLALHRTIYRDKDGVYALRSYMLEKSFRLLSLAVDI